ncbi:hypothetical protein BASA81_017032 [Batrachochytrium salamandrivorans]|nr:hypothetical protein BASA81_017032 [Batrachochytrium salamandrivorans]
MKKDLKDYISRCPECQLNRSASRTHAPLPIDPVPPVALPFERWGIDFYGPMVETKSGSKYLITCIDYATRWVLAKPVREMTEAAVATFLYDLMMTYGAPFEIISDRGKSFLAEGISEFERENSIRHLATTPYHPQTNGMVERMHAMLGHGLTTLVADKRDRWDEYLPQELRRSWSSTISSKCQDQRLKLKPCENETDFDENTPDYYFKVGDMVKMKHHDRQKLEFNWKGPYHVVDVGHPGTYWIMTPQGLRLPNAVNQGRSCTMVGSSIDNVDFFYDGTNRNSSLDS